MPLKKNLKIGLFYSNYWKIWMALSSLVAKLYSILLKHSNEALVTFRGPKFTLGHAFPQIDHL
jgi:hypothetical protein